MTRRWIAAIAVVVLAGAPVGASPRLDWRSAGPYGGWVTGFARSASDPAVVYATLLDAGFYRSVDGGTTWRDGNADLRAGDLTNLAVNPLNRSSVWVGGKVGQGTPVVLHSKDGGVHWTTLAALGQAGLAGVGPGAVYVFTTIGLQRSLNDGRSWQVMGSGPGGVIDSMAVDSDDPNLLYAAVHGTNQPGVFVSTDGGATWRPPSSGTETVFLVRTDPHQRGVVVGMTPGQLLRSLDAGHSWTPIGPRENDYTIKDFSFGTGSPSDVMFLVTTTPTSVLVVDGRTGNTVRLPADPEGTATPEAISPDPKHPGAVLVGDQAGIRRTVDGGRSWSATNQGLGGVRSGAIAVRGRNAFFAGEMRTGDAGRHWSPLPVSGVLAFAVDPSDPRIVYAATYLDTPVWKSTDGGRSWSASWDGGEVGGGSSSLAIDPVHPGTVYFGAGGLAQSHDGGATWQWLDAPTGGDVYQVVVQSGKPGCVYIASDNGVGRSCDSGTTWTALLGGSSFGAVAVSSDGRWIYAIENQGQYPPPDVVHLWRSQDGGLNFDSVESPSGGGAVPSLEIDARDPSVVYLGADPGGLWRRRGDGDWEDLTAGLPNPSVTALHFDLRGGPRLFVGTQVGLRILRLGEQR